MEMATIINYLTLHLDKTDITLYTGAPEALIQQTEKQLNIKLPNDMKEFYRFCNGFESDEDIFRIVPLDEMLERTLTGKELIIAEYLIYCDYWYLEFTGETKSHYRIMNTYKTGQKISLTPNFAQFIHCFLKGGVFEKGGLYDWHEQLI